jgi:hypothetical protein
MQAYSDPTRDNDPHALPDIETFYVFAEDADWIDDDGNFYPEGWYYWVCFPGCLPDGDAIGPFDTADDAIADAQDVDY